jgi:hypothetical protein
VTAAELQKAVEEALAGYQRGQLLWLVLTLVAFAVGALLGAYLKKKGENLATREDVGAITEKVESIKTEHAARLQELAHQNRQILEQQTRRHQLRLAALDKRLTAHQEAYALWRKLMRAAVATDPAVLPEVVSDCQGWWQDNCLFLTAEARDAFHKAFHCAEKHADYQRDGDLDGRKKNWSAIRAAGEAIVRGVELPSLGERESD